MEILAIESKTIRARRLTYQAKYSQKDTAAHVHTESLPHPAYIDCNSNRAHRNEVEDKEPVRRCSMTVALYVPFVIGSGNLIARSFRLSSIVDSNPCLVQLLVVIYGVAVLASTTWPTSRQSYRSRFVQPQGPAGGVIREELFARSQYGSSVCKDSPFLERHRRCCSSK